MTMRPEQRDRIGGVAMMVLGAAAAWKGVGYRLGTLTNMGPGFFPAAIMGYSLFIAVLLRA